jgi:hypothetical protein
VVFSGELFHATAAPDTKPVPFTVSVKAAPPALAEFGLRPVIAGASDITEKLTLLDVTSPLDTVTVTIAAEAMRLADTDAVNCVELTKEVESAEPFHCTVAPERNPVPFTVSGKAAPPTVAELGLRLVIRGIGGFATKLAPLWLPLRLLNVWFGGVKLYPANDGVTV